MKPNMITNTSERKCLCFKYPHLRPWKTSVLSHKSTWTTLVYNLIAAKKLKKHKEMENKRDVDVNNNMSEKIINKLSTILKDFNTIDDFSIIHSSSNSLDRNVSPVHYEETERCLGLESWCVKQIFSYCQRQIHHLHKQIAIEPSTEDVSKLNVYLNIALLLQADVNTFWNCKRKFALYLSVQKELLFAKLVLSHSPKSLQAYFYRSWLIRNQKNWDYNNVLKEELLVVNKAVHQSANNYHAWNHRIFCMEYLWIKTDNFGLLLEEYEYSNNFINQHVSEYSGFHYRQYVLQRFQSFEWCNIANPISLTFQANISSKLGNYGRNIQNGVDYLSLMLYELVEVCKQLNVFYPGHESVWYHRRFIWNEIYKQINNQISTNQLYENLVLYERQFVHSLIKSSNLVDKEYCDKHQKWLKCFFGIRFNWGSCFEP